MTKHMRYYVVSIMLFAAPFLGCAQQEEQAFAPTRSPTAPIATTRTAVPMDAVTNHLITTFGEHLGSGGWTVQVSQGTVNARPQGVSSKFWPWSAHAGWFVSIENDRRVWAYDGDRNLWLFECATAAKDGGAMSLSGPNKFPGHPVPETILARLSRTTRKSIQQNE